MVPLPVQEAASDLADLITVYLQGIHAAKF